jgi:serine/threonine protein kinase
MSSVYLAHDQAEDQFCVIKTLVSVDAQRDPDWSREAAACLRREADLLGQVEHPRIARLLDRVSVDQGEFLLLEYIAGRTLEQRLTRVGPNGVVIPGAALPLEEALAYAASVAATLDYLATLPQPLLHLDIKPANLILPPDQNEPILVDFGGAMLWQQTGATTRLAGYGTPGYAAPEQYQGQASPQSDVYGLGATLYHLLTDDDPTAHPLDFPALATLPPDIATLLASALAHDPAARPTADGLCTHLRMCATNRA